MKFIFGTELLLPIIQLKTFNSNTMIKTITTLIFIVAFYCGYSQLGKTESEIIAMKGKCNKETVDKNGQKSLYYFSTEKGGFQRTTLYSVGTKGVCYSMMIVEPISEAKEWLNYFNSTFEKGELENMWIDNKTKNLIDVEFTENSIDITIALKNFMDLM